MGQFQDKTIRDVVDDMNHRHFLPDIQREYVWLSKPKENKIEEFFDSILRGYPIGSFLFWKLNKNDFETGAESAGDSGKLNFQLYKFIENFDERKPHNEKISVNQINVDELSIVLDGQQRITSLYIGLKGSRTLKRPYGRWDDPNAFEEKHLYLNIRYIPVADDPEKNNYEFKFRGEGDNLSADDSHYWFKVGDILKLNSVLSYARENDLSDYEGRLLEELQRTCCKDKLISYFEEKEKNLDKVLQIFIRVNSGGTQLSYSDMLMSILTATFSSDIRKNMNEFVATLSANGFSVMGRDQVLKTCLLLSECDTTRFILKNFNKANISKIEENWRNITDAISSAVKLLGEFGYRDRLSSAYIISIVAMAMHKFGKGAVKGDKDELRKFVRNAQITGYFSASLDTKLAIFAHAFADAVGFSDVNQKLAAHPSSPLKISNDDIEGMMERGYGDAVYPVLQALYPDIDFSTQAFHVDHIYPRSKFTGRNKRVPDDHHGNYDLLYNLQLLPGETNQEKSDKDPEEWLKDHFENDADKIRAYKEKNYIPGDFELTWENIEEFEEIRRKRILEKLKSIFLMSQEKSKSEKK